LSANLPKPKIRIEIYHGASTIVPVDENLTKQDVLELEITLPILSRGIGGATFKLQNFNGAYTNSISVNDRVAIWLYREGETATKVFGGRISKLTYEGLPGAPEYYMHVECMDYGAQLQAPPSLLTKTYVNTNGKTILIDAISLCPDLSTTSVDPSNAIASTHTIGYDEALPWDVVREILDAAKKADGTTGFDGYIDPTGDVHVFPWGSNTSSVDLTDKIIKYQREVDSYRIKNKIKVYGDKGGSYPTDQDTWTLDNAANWTAEVGTISASTDYKVGTNALQCSSGLSGGDQICSFKRTFNPILGIGPSGYDYVAFWIKYTMAPSQGEIIRLLAPDDSNYFYVAMPVTPPTTYTYLVYYLGPDQEYSAEHTDKPWRKVGSPDWRNIQGVKFYARRTQEFAVLVDGLHFGMGRYRYTSEVSSSQTLYGVRMCLPVFNNELKSDGECQKAGDGLIRLYKDPVTTWQVRTFGNNGFKPGDMQPIVIANDNVNTTFRITEIRHIVRDVWWETVLI